MNELVKAPRALPRLSPDLICALGNQVSNRFGPSDDGKRRPGEPTPGMILNIRTPTPSRKVVREAQNALEGYKALLAPTGSEMLLNNLWWLLAGINGAIRNPLGEAALELRVKLAARTISEFPSGAWDDDLLGAALKRFEFMPSVAEISAFLEERALILRAKVSRIEAVASWQFKEPEKVSKLAPEELAERQAIVEKARKEREAAERHEALIREMGCALRPEWEGLTGQALIEALEKSLPSMSGDMKEITLLRIAMLKKAASYAAALLS